MKLTQKQEAQISRYLRDVAIQLDHGLPEEHRQHGLTQIERRIMRHLQGLKKEYPDDVDLEAVLDHLGTPARQAAMMSPRRDPSRTLMLPRDERVWLGVCAGVASRADVEPWVVRVFTFLLGLVLGPLLIAAYVGLYLHMRQNSPQAEPPLDTLRIAGRGGLTFLVAVVMHVATGYIIRLIHFIYTEIMLRDVPAVGDWGWIYHARDQYLFYAVVAALPLAVLSGFPLAGGWDQTLKRLSQAALAIYGMVLSFGLASLLVGLILDYVQQFAG